MTFEITTASGIPAGPPAAAGPRRFGSQGRPPHASAGLTPTASRTTGPGGRIRRSTRRSPREGLTPAPPECPDCRGSAPRVYGTAALRAHRGRALTRVSGRRAGPPPPDLRAGRGDHGPPDRPATACRGRRLRPARTGFRWPRPSPPRRPYGRTADDPRRGATRGTAQARPGARIRKARRRRPALSGRRRRFPPVHALVRAPIPLPAREKALGLVRCSGRTAHPAIRTAEGRRRTGAALRWPRAM